MARKSVSKVARPRVKCRYNTRRTYPLHRVPFAWKGKPLDTDGPRNLYWNMPEIEGYLNGCDFGKAAASAWLKACLETSSDGANYSAASAPSCIACSLPTASTTAKRQLPGRAVGGW